MPNETAPAQEMGEINEAVDPLDGDPRLPTVFGDAWGAVTEFRAMLVSEGVRRGLVGPREIPRLWERHLLNSAAAVPFLPTSGRIIDLGSGAGLPGIVVAAMLPGADVVLLEPMERRTEWLGEVIDHLGLRNVVVMRGRAEDVQGTLTGQAVTARAVAPLDRLYRWALPLLGVGGVLVALKGARAGEEVVAAAKVAARLGARPAQVLSAQTMDGLEATTVVRVVREVVRGVR